MQICTLILFSIIYSGITAGNRTLARGGQPVMLTAEHVQKAVEDVIPHDQPASPSSSLTLDVGIVSEEE
eukprot:1237261-Amphidinium_carterae.1